ncbi:MAG: hypothetical protein JSW35_03755 [Deltaproteobacteria bacterium]|nr:MAG: hypothetical protein JSW35_03755 [Deltaproteobacteria bacterium]
MMPGAERVEFFSCGQEANMMAIRLSRIFTGRKKVLRFRENFHGWADELVHEGSAGIVADEVNVIPFNDLKLVEKELATKEYAALLTEGGGAYGAGRVHIDVDFVRALPGLTKRISGWPRFLPLVGWALANKLMELTAHTILQLRLCTLPVDVTYSNRKPGDLREAFHYSSKLYAGEISIYLS